MFTSIESFIFLNAHQMPSKLSEHCDISFFKPFVVYDENGLQDLVKCRMN
jgi:hypothetical protein